MKRKYNIALTPVSKREKLIRLAQPLSSISGPYCLGAGSFPHVTLLQFHANEHLLETLWESVCKNIKPQRLTLSFPDFSVTTSNNILFWVALMPDQRALLHQMHLAAAEAVQEPPYERYDPHLTLINTLDPACQNKLDILRENYSTINDDFVLSIGDCDACGQVTAIIRTC